MENKLQTKMDNDQSLQYEKKEKTYTAYTKLKYVIQFADNEEWILNCKSLQYKIFSLVWYTQFQKYDYYCNSNFEKIKFNAP